MLTDPQTITVNSLGKVMPKVETGGQHSLYQLGDLTFSLDVRHTARVVNKKNRTRSLVTFNQRKVVSDPLTSVNDFENLIVSVQIDRPEAGFTSLEVQQMVAGFQAWLTATMVDKLYGRES